MILQKVSRRPISLFFTRAQIHPIAGLRKIDIIEEETKEVARKASHDLDRLSPDGDGFERVAL
jgi:hypothetical protein